MRTPPLDHARTYLEPSGWENSRLSRIAWHAWPAAIVIALLSFLSMRLMMLPSGSSDFEVVVNMTQQWHDLPILALILAGFAFFHVVANLGFLLFDDSKAFGWRLLDAGSILITLAVIAACLIVVLTVSQAGPIP